MARDQLPADVTWYRAHASAESASAPCIAPVVMIRSSRSSANEIPIADEKEDEGSDRRQADAEEAKRNLKPALPHDDPTVGSGHARIVALQIKYDEEGGVARGGERPSPGRPSRARQRERTE